MFGSFVELHCDFQKAYTSVGFQNEIMPVWIQLMMEWCQTPVLNDICIKHIRLFCEGFDAQI